MGFANQPITEHAALQRTGHTACYQWKLGLKFIGTLSTPVFTKLQLVLPDVDIFINAPRKGGERVNTSALCYWLWRPVSSGQKWYIYQGQGSPSCAWSWVCSVHPRVPMAKPVVIVRLRVRGVRLCSWLASQSHALITWGLAWRFMCTDSVFLGCLSW